MKTLPSRRIVVKPKAGVYVREARGGESSDGAGDRSCCGGEGAGDKVRCVVGSRKIKLVK